MARAREKEKAKEEVPKSELESVLEENSKIVESYIKAIKEERSEIIEGAEQFDIHAGERSACDSISEIAKVSEQISEDGNESNSVSEIEAEYGRNEDLEGLRWAYMTDDEADIQMPRADAGEKA